MIRFHIYQVWYFLGMFIRVNKIMQKYFQRLESHVEILNFCLQYQYQIPTVSNPDTFLSYKNKINISFQKMTSPTNYFYLDGD